MKNALNQPLTVHAAPQNNKEPRPGNSEELMSKQELKANFVQISLQNLNFFERQKKTSVRQVIEAGMQSPYLHPTSMGSIGKN
ncbi:MAG: hypothetical protein KGM99_20600 [Burkholderiales bacterium]|nr:hypothetical protein [Burkholderiales bacterium]